MVHHAVVSQKEWTQARVSLLEKEKAQTRLRDAIAAERRALPWVKVEKDYSFDTEDGPRSLSDLFDGRSQLIIKHFMFGPEWSEGCTGCSFEMDHFEGAMLHIPHHDLTLVAVSRAPLKELLKFRQRMGWTIPWVSSASSDFNFDFGVSFTEEQRAAGRVVYNYREENFQIDELSGLSVFYKDEDGVVYHTYSTFGRGAEEILTSYMLLDLTPKGRNETGPNHNLTDWVLHHDRYGDNGQVANADRIEAEAGACCKS
ncbi:DUF899 domain-containing protein [Aureimonas fodinaquatilis]|uniref:DUF899 domain-containing protein n=1 Tax=Aureimonas fodinaquatilis TaxID=2565783 RepID=A0A5B0DSW4_9HYPH|nr:thioredoxin family protein [Aureimonas fodinaquatilis]KAA0968219.1 DUF899 domain-containing protein [Aureimonas fodinaquatilis]